MSFRRQLWQHQDVAAAAAALVQKALESGATDNISVAIVCLNQWQSSSSSSSVTAVGDQEDSYSSHSSAGGGGSSISPVKPPLHSMRRVSTTLKCTTH